MTEKQYGLIPNWCIYENIDGIEKWLKLDEVCNLLNELHEENEQSKRMITTLRNIILEQEDLEKENKELKDKSYFKKEIRRLRLQNKDLLKSNAKLREENKKLKQELKIYRKIAKCSNCEYHNYDWFDDGDEFEICEKGKDMEDRICEEWREL